VEPPFFPVVDDLADPQTFLHAAANGAAESGIAVIIGTNRDEARAIVAGQPEAHGATGADADGSLRSTADGCSATDWWRRGRGRPIDTLAEAMTDTAFVRPARRFAADATRAGAPVWVYRLDWAPLGSPFGACHCLELPLIFDTGGGVGRRPNARRLGQPHQRRRGRAHALDVALVRRPRHALLRHALAAPRHPPASRHGLRPDTRRGEPVLRTTRTGEDLQPGKDQQR
jgi:carboxylesterase type B